MKTFLFIFLAGYAVKCDDNYYVVQMPDRIQQKEFKVHWNVPTMQCKSKKIPFTDLFQKYGIIQNTNDTHRGDKISILYDPGFFPALVKNETTGEIRYRNGGVPQQGDLMEHLQIFKHEMEKSIPDESFNGVGIIDFESWRPVLRQNFGVLTPYKDVSFDIEKKRHWWWKKQWIQEEAKRRFEASGRDFMQTTLALARKMRPRAVWGYYGYPQCFNRPYTSQPESCAKEMPSENNAMDWLWSESTALYPSVYSSVDMSAYQLAAFIRGRIKEAARVRYKGTPILPYWWFRYRDGGYFSQSDLDVSFSTFYKSNASGFIIWGSSKDVNTVEKCTKLKAYVTDVLGPTIAKYTKPIIRIDDVPDEISQTTTTFGPEVATKLDPEYTWVPPDNYTQNIEHIVDEELKRENQTDFDRDKKNMTESALIDLVLHKIADYCAENCRRKNKPTDEVTSVSPIAVTTKNPFKETAVKIETTAGPKTTTEDDFMYDYTDTSTITIADSNDLDDDETTVKPSTDTNTTNEYSKNTNTYDTSTSEVIYDTDIEYTTTSSTNNHNRSLSKEDFSIYDTSGIHFSLNNTDTSNTSSVETEIIDFSSNETETTDSSSNESNDFSTNVTNSEKTSTTGLPGDTEVTWKAVDYILKSIQYETTNNSANNNINSEMGSTREMETSTVPVSTEQVIVEVV